jgi:hypothetical protein
MSPACQTLDIIACNDAGETDTMTIGLRLDAALGIDTGVGKVNIFEKPVDSTLDPRILQRSLTDIDCISAQLDTLRNCFKTP